MQNSASPRSFYLRWLSAISGIVLGAATALVPTIWHSSITSPPADAKGSNGDVVADNAESSRAGLLTIPNAHQFSKLLEGVRASGRITIADRVKLQLAAYEWLAVNPVECVNQLRTLGALGIIPEKLLLDRIRGHGAHDLTNTVNIVKRLESPATRNRLLKAVFMEEGAENPNEALQLLPYLPADVRSDITRTFTNNWIAKSPSEAGPAIVNNADIPANFKNGALLVWARIDGLAALSFAMNSGEFQSPSARRRIASAIIENHAAKSPAQALAAYKSLPLNLQESAALARIYARLAETDANSLAQELSGSPLSLRTLEAASAALKATAAENPSSIEALWKLIPGERARGEGFRKVATQKAIEDPHSAAAWVEKLENPFVRDAAMASVAEHWMMNAPESALKFATDQIKTGKRTDWLDESCEVMVRLVKSENQQQNLNHAMQQLTPSERATIATYLESRPRLKELLSVLPMHQ